MYGLSNVEKFRPQVTSEGQGPTVQISIRISRKRCEMEGKCQYKTLMFNVSKALRDIKCQ